MATSTFLMQGISKDDGHYAAVQAILRMEGLSSATISVAFATAKGIAIIAPELRKIKDKVECFVGIRNGITTVQSLKSLLDIGIHPYCVDTGSSFITFHPKIYFAEGANSARILLGSSNLTPAGLSTNFEAGCLMELSCSDANDLLLIKSLRGTFSALRSISKDHVYQISALADAISLFEDGLLVDERRVKATSTGAASKQSGRGRVKIIPRKCTVVSTKGIDLDVPGLPAPIKPKAKPMASASTSGKSTKGASIQNRLGYDPEWVLVWESKGLSERDLNIPKGNNTNATGSMLLKAGARTDIDFQRYFRNEVFDGLNWVNDGVSTHLHLASARFEIRVGGISHGIFTLEIRHNSDETSKSFKQKNGMTGLRWGSAKPIIAQDDLLGRTLRLFRAPDEKDLFLIEIDY